MKNIVSFGYWVRRRRKVLDKTQVDLAREISCSLSMLRKIERDERRPSAQLAELLADHLAIDDAQRSRFLQIARGQFVPDMPSPVDMRIDFLGALPTFEDQAELGQAPFVAREVELRQLHEHLDRAVDGKGRMLFVVGEAGRGKTSLLQAFAREAITARPNLIVTGGSSDVFTGLGDPLLPFRDIFRLLTGDIDNVGMTGIVNRELASRIMRALPLTAEILLNHGPHLIDTLVSGSVLETRLSQSLIEYQNGTGLLGRLHEQRVRQVQATFEIQQDRLFEEISTSLSFLARQNPLLLILDDLHWVDTSSASLLGHLVSRLRQSPILLVGSFRPEDLAQGRETNAAAEQVQHPLQVVLGESRRLFGQNRIDLDHPGTELVFVSALLDEEPNRLDQDFRKQLAQVTEGNALFAVELLRDMKERGDVKQDDHGFWLATDTLSWEHIPARVEGIIEKRIGRLPVDLRELLTIGCVQGESFYAEVIAQVRQVTARDLTRMLSADLDRKHRLIREQGVQHAGTERLSQFRFRHHLFQKYLYDRLGKAERMYLHQEVGNALEALSTARAGKDDVPAAHLARHFREARLNVKASHYLYLAGQKAAFVVAFDEAVAYFERGLGLLEKLAVNPQINRLRFDLSLALARAYWHGGHLIKAISASEQSIEIARTLKDPGALSRAVLSYEEPRWRLNLDVKPSQQYIREALTALGDDEDGLRSRLLVSLSRTLLASGEHDELHAMVDEALDIARRINDPVALCDGLRISAHIDRRPEMLHVRLANVEELIVTAQANGDQERVADGLGLYIYDQLELGHIDQVDKAIMRQQQIAQEIKQPFQLHIAAVLQTMRTIMRGEFQEAERLANKAADISRQIGLAALDGILGIHMFTIRAEQGRLHEVAPIVKLYVSGSPASASWRPGLALVYRALGLKDECAAVFEELALENFASVPYDSLWVASMAYLAEVCTFLADSDRAAVLYRLLLPYDGRTVVSGGATACYGAAARYLGILSTTMSDWSIAEHHFEGALELDQHIGARPWLAHSQYEYAAMLLARGQSAGRPRALNLLDKGMASAHTMGMAYLVQKITSLQLRYELA